LTHGKTETLEEELMRDVIVVIGAGSIGVAIARRVGVGKHVMLADIKLENAEAAAKTMLDAGMK
jgi:predicted dinucleotide-binding enzyme